MDEPGLVQNTGHAVLAAAYARASTAAQSQSPQTQIELLQRYAVAHSMRIGETYIDAACSGLHADKRLGFQRLMADIVNGRALFTVLLICDVSRWGRYQNVDDAAFYEFQCRRAGISVIYCAEPFSNDGTPVSQLTKSIKRSMAAEYSRELSTKVFAGQRRLALQGFKQGGAATYGMRRMAISAQGEVLRVLGAGECKPHPTDRVRLAPGDDVELAVVRRIFRQYVDEGVSASAIARRLNADGVPCGARLWNPYLVTSVLSRSQYWGEQCYNRVTQRLRSPTQRNPPDQWVRSTQGLTPIVTAEDGAAAAKVRAMRNGHDRAAVLELLRRAHACYGEITVPLLDGLSGMPCVSSLRHMFGSVAAACREAGISQAFPHARRLEARDQAARLVALSRQIARAATLAGGSAVPSAGRNDLLLINGSVRVRVVLLCCGSDSRQVWRLRVRSVVACDFVLAGLLDPGNVDIDRYALVDIAIERRDILYIKSGRSSKNVQLLYPSLEAVFGLPAGACGDSVHGDEIAAGTQVVAAAYVRMSTDRQDQSIAQQLEYLSRYAATAGLTLGRIYKDEGKSGLTLQRRAGLRQLLADIADGSAGFTVLLVCDVSRLGRFQDADESAYYEVLCRRGGVRVQYCAEPFAAEEAPLTHVMKDVKRLMAAEYSRQLSEKVIAAHAYMLARGYKAGGAAGYGLRRASVCSDGTVRRLLERGERKSAHTDHVVLVPGPQEEVVVVRRIFALYLQQALSYGALARRLNEEGVHFTAGGKWTDVRVRAILTNDKYCGNLTYNRTSKQLGSARRINEAGAWLRASGAHPGLVSQEEFARAQDLRITKRGLSRKAVLERLAALHARHGRLSYRLIEAEPDLPHAALIKKMFGSLLEAYQLAVPALRSAAGGSARIFSWAMRNELAERVQRCIALTGHKAAAINAQGRLCIDNQVVVQLAVLHVCKKGRSIGWRVPAGRVSADFVVAELVALDAVPSKYLLLRTSDFAQQQLWISERHPSPECVVEARELYMLFGPEKD